MNIKDFILGYLIGKGDGGGGASVEPLEVTENGTYSEEGVAYSPVTVDVPNSYSAGDEGKVVSNGALVAQSSDTVTQNGTVDTTLINSLLVNVASGGGGLEYEEGTWTPSADIDRYRIPLKNEHTTPPAIYVIVDSTGTNAPANSCMHVCYTDDTFFGGPMFSAPSGTAKIYGYANYVNMNSSNTSANRKTLNAKATSGDPSDYGSTNARFWATESSIYAFCDSSSLFWRSGRTYKWFAVWVPTSA